MMKPIVTLAVCVLFIALNDNCGHAQNESNIEQPLSVRADGAAPDTSAMFEVQSTSRGVLIPRMTSAQRQAIAGPTTGLLVFDSDEMAFYFYDGSGWLALVDQGNSYWQKKDTSVYYSGGNVGIGVDTPASKLQVQSGSVLFNGEMGTTPVSGPGTRLMWIPEKAAFRAGTVGGTGEDSTLWDPDSIGLLSFAFGRSSLAKGDHSIALGRSAIARANQSVAIGNFTNALGNGSFAIGSASSATGTNSIAFGNILSASGSNAVNIGSFNNAGGMRSTALGYDNTASGNNSSAIGTENTASGSWATALGYKTSATGSRATSLGSFTNSAGFASTASGSATSAIGNYSFSMGLNTTASGQVSLSGGIQSFAVGDRSVAVGDSVRTQGYASLALGKKTWSSSYAETSIGAWNVISGGDPDSWIPTDPIFAIGNGMNQLNRNNALTVLKNGDLGIDTETPLARLHATGGAVLFEGETGTTPVSGPGTRLMWIPEKGALRAGRLDPIAADSTDWDQDSIGLYSVAFGKGTKATGKAGMAIGEQSNATGLRAVAMGYRTTASGQNSLAVGEFTNANGGESIAVGEFCNAGFQSAAFGFNANASGSRSIATGESDATGYGTAAFCSSNSTGFYSFASGFNSESTNDASFAAGWVSKATGERSVALGSFTQARGNHSIALGSGAHAAGFAAIAGGRSVRSPSQGEITFGSYNTVYTPNDTFSFHPQDRLFTLGNGTSNADRSDALVMLKNGNLGLGGSNPGNKLQMNQDTGDIRLSMKTNASWTIHFEQTESSVFSIYNGGNPRLTIRSNGRIGIGTTDPQARLHCTGSVRFSALGAGTVMSDADGDLSVSSDIRLKNVEGPFTRGLAEILELQPIVYKWKEESGLDTDYSYAGFSAQDVQAAIPEAVGQDAAGYLTLSDRPIIAGLVNAVKEQQETIRQQSNEISELKGMLSEVLERLDRAEKEGTNASTGN